MAEIARRKRRKRRKTRCRVSRKRKRRKSKASYSQKTDFAFESRRRRKCQKKKKRRKKRKPNPAPVLQPVPPKPKPKAPAQPSIQSPIAVYGGTFGVRQAERLLWRAGFGPSPGHAQALARMGVRGAVQWFTRPVGAAALVGAAPKDNDGAPLAPYDAWGHDHLWFLDRMVRTTQPLQERMTLIWHDWFATSNDGVGSQRLMLDQNALFRRTWLGSFQQLVLDVTADPAMILWLNQDENRRQDPNENYARELMELFTLGADRGAYTEGDVRELARALTGWDSDWSAELGDHNFRFVPSRHDTGNKTVFGKTGNYDWQDACRLCVQHQLHPSFFVDKLWSYFNPTPPSASDRQKLASAYVSSGYQVRPIVEAILLHPSLYTGPRMVKPPAVFIAGLLRTLRRSIDTESWVWLAEGAGQRLFYPPNVSGWDDSRWLDTSTTRGRWQIVAQATEDRYIAGSDQDGYDATETPEAAVAAARAFWLNPPLTGETIVSLTSFAQASVAGSLANWQQHTYRALRQNALRQLVAMSPDLQAS